LLGLRQGFLRSRPKFLQRQQRIALVVEAPAIRSHVIKPDVVCAATASLGEEQDRCAHTGIGAEPPQLRGISEVTLDAVWLSVLLTTLAGRHNAARRELLARLVERLGREGIALAGSAR